MRFSLVLIIAVAFVLAGCRGSSSASSAPTSTPAALAVNHATVQKKSSSGQLLDVLRDYTLNLDTAASADLSNGLAARVST